MAANAKIPKSPVDWHRKPEPKATELPANLLHASAVEETLSFSEDGVHFEPLDLVGSQMTLEVTIAACQARCAKTVGCAHFSYWEPQRHCHLQGVLAERVEGSLWRAGPPGCSESRMSEATRRITDRMSTCYHRHATYQSQDWVAAPVAVASIGHCQQLCQEVAGCAHFAYMTASGMCYFARNGAEHLEPVPFTVAGPRHCPTFLSMAVSEAEAKADVSPFAAAVQHPMTAHILPVLTGAGLVLAAVGATYRRQRGQGATLEELAPMTGTANSEA